MNLHEDSMSNYGYNYLLAILQCLVHNLRIDQKPFLELYSRRRISHIINITTP